MNIVVVDDEKIILNAMCRVLSKSGHEVYPFSSCEGALQSIQSLNPGVVFLDVKMPGCSGLDLLKDIRSKGISSKVIMMSGYTTSEIINAARELGVVTFLKKPFDDIHDILKIVEDNSL
jgi:two-component system, response regulator PdtaR